MTRVLSLTVGEDSYARGLFAGSAALGGGDLLWALDYGQTDGPWDLDEDLQRSNALLKYSVGERRDGYSITASLYDGEWTSTDQIPERAVSAGVLDRFGFVDPTNGGDSHRYALNLEVGKPHRRLELPGQCLRARLPARSLLQLHVRARSGRTAISSSSSTIAMLTGCTPSSRATPTTAASPARCVLASTRASMTSAKWVSISPTTARDCRRCARIRCSAWASDSSSSSSCRPPTGCE